MSAYQARIPAWVTGEAEEPESVSTLLYLDEVESIESVRDVLRLWYGTAGGALLAAAVPEGWAPPRPSVSATQWVSIAEDRVAGARFTRWDQGLNEQLYHLQGNWCFDSEEPYIPYAVSTFASRSHLDGPRQLVLRAGASFPPLREEGVLAAAVELVRVVADAADLAYGQISFSAMPDRFDPYQPGLNAGINRDPRKATEPARAALRGYDWVTVVPPELVERLGGADALRATGAFHRVVGLAHGGALAQATESPRAFTREAARAVADALRPVFASVRTAESWGVEVTDDVAGMVRQWRIEGYGYTDLALVADRILGSDAGTDWRLGMALCRESAVVLGEDADECPWS
ncbi:type VI immunity family protein [Dactylosporangium sp. NPDC051484]|uniref:type VI immunity family protein n=1 Tax=Dactylosporangium sp. NPDC051484 TaxID=3154942 RepID=UPI00344F6B0B